MASKSVIGPPAPASGSSRRRDPRSLTLLIVGRITGGNADGLCRIRNISTGGLMAEVCASFAADEAVRIELRNGQVIAGQVRWTRDGALGVQFDTPVGFVVATLLGAMLGWVVKIRAKHWSVPSFLVALASSCILSAAYAAGIHWLKLAPEAGGTGEALSFVVGALGAYGGVSALKRLGGFGGEGGAEAEA